MELTKQRLVRQQLMNPVQQADLAAGHAFNNTFNLVVDGIGIAA